MRSIQLFTAFLWIGAVVIPMATAAERVDYVNDVLPILETHCIGCHAEGDAEGGFVMESHAAMMAGGESGLAITAGAAGSSRMLLMAQGKLQPMMPPEDEDPLSEAQLEVISAWIEQGAIGPDGDMPIRREIRVPKIATFEGVAKPITAIAISPKGTHHATAEYGKVTFRDPKGTAITSFTSGLGKVNSIQFSKDGQQLLVASGATGAYGTAAIFDIPTGKLVQEFVGHRDILYVAVFSPDETIVATAGYDREIILWDSDTGQPIRSLLGHNGAIFDLAFSPDGKRLVSACADETAKVWHVESGQRLDTLSQPEGEVFAVDFTRDGKHILAASADNRLRVWKSASIDQPSINPIVATRFLDDSPLVNFQVSPDGKTMVVLSAGGQLKVVETANWNQFAVLAPLEETGSDLSISPDGKFVLVSQMNGRIARRELPSIDQRADDDPHQAGTAGNQLQHIFMDLGDLKEMTELAARDAAKDNSSSVTSPNEPELIRVGRGVQISGTISKPNEMDHYCWSARAGECWAIDADADAESPIDTIVTVLGADGQSVLRTRLQAVRDSYFTFRGKNSSQFGDYRVFNWQEMRLNEYYYASGEVNRLFMYPRGPDSGFNVYPNERTRWTYFGTTPMTHALGEPSYIVRPLAASEDPLANGLPTFDVYYENDDDPMRLAGKGSRLLFVAPTDGLFSVRITDTSGAGSKNHKYRLAIRAAEPSFKPSVDPVKGAILKGSGREFRVRVDRIDGFEGPVVFDLEGLPPGVVTSAPLTIQAGQCYADATVWVSESAKAWEGKVSPKLVARADINGQSVEREVGTIGELSLEERPNAIASIHPLGDAVAEHEDWTLRIRRGETVKANVVVRRKKDFTSQVSFGKENAGRNTVHGVYVNDIGLNGLLVRENESEREFSLTADPIAQLGKRSFFLTAAINGNVTTHPITVEVLP